MTDCCRDFTLERNHGDIESKGNAYFVQFCCCNESACGNDGNHQSFRLKYCPFCGSELSPPPQKGDAGG